MTLVPYLIITPLASAFLIPLGGKRVKAAGAALASLATFVLMCLSFFVASYAMSGRALVCKYGNWVGPAGITLVVDAFSALMLVVINVVAFLIVIYSISYVEKYTDKWKFFTLLMLMMGGINGVLIAGDIFNLYVFLEIAAISGYFLVAFNTDTDGLEASFKYAVMGSVASVFILLGIAFLYAHTSTLNMADMAEVLASKGPSDVVRWVSVLFLMGFGLKAALVPFHSWLPYAHSAAPAPVSATLSALSIKVLGIYAMARVFFNIFGMTKEVSYIVISLGVLSMIVGGLLAFGQSDIKRVFAYSSISQIGYIALGLGLATPLAIFGALFHLLNHSVFKSLLFLNSGSIERLTGTRQIPKIDDVAAKSPVTGYTALIGALSISGIPPLAGFWSKLIIILACMQAGRPGLAAIAILVSMLTLAYYFRVLTPALFRTAPSGDSTGRERAKISAAMAFSVIMLALLSAAGALILLPGTGNLLLSQAANSLAAGKDYAILIMGR